jgi:1-phosphatidylinositol-4-phosphate 5-kinase
VRCSLDSFSDGLIANAAKPGYLSIFQAYQGGLRGFDETGGNKPVTRREIYFLGIIDILQEFNFKKAIESTYKGIRFNKNAISAIASHKFVLRLFVLLAVLTIFFLASGCA